MDLAVSTQELPKKGESVLGSSILQSPGGKGANQAVAAALVGGNVSLISMRGNDQYGRELIDSAKASGVDVSLVQISDQELTGTAVIAVDSHGDNMIVISPGANSLITPEIASSNLKLAENVSVVSICGELPLPTIKASLETANGLGATSVLNLSPYNPAALEFLNLAKVLVVNQHEAADITGVSNPLQDWTATIAGFAALGCTTVVVTLGADGAMILDCVDQNAAPVKVDSVKVKAVDTTGCGDAFTGAMCVELANGKDISTAVKFAVQVAAFAATSAGAQRSYGTLEQIGISCLILFARSNKHNRVGGGESKANQRVGDCVNQLRVTGSNRVSTPRPNALINITRPENNTDASLPRLATENMFPARATKVMPIMRIAHSSSGVVALVQVGN